MTDPGSGEVLGQVELTGEVDPSPEAPSRSLSPEPGVGVDQAAVDATFFALVADMAGAPRELVDTDTGDIAGRVSQSLYGRRTWRGGASSPLLFAGQYEDAESGWVYNRFRFYDPTAGVYGAQDPLGITPKIATAQGYVDHAVGMVDHLGLYAHQVSAPPFVHTMHNKGVVGEQAVDNILKRNGGDGIGERVRYEDSMGRLRISDGSRADGLIEVKNVKNQGMTPQLEAAVEKSKSMGGKLDLYVARETYVTSGVTNNSNINVIRMSREDIVQASKDVFHGSEHGIFKY